ncbi:MAG: lytic murein transglycosylase [Alphaproteobacteria bacterium]|nr:lytic murein transglycosylase [Alphaproteobacteria bacterium]
MIKKIITILVCLFIFADTSFAKVKPIDVQKQEWNEWLEELKNDMINKGISKKTIDNAYKNDYFHAVKEVVLQDKKQAEFVLTSDKYINRLVNKNKVELARNHYNDLKDKYSSISDEYGIPLNFLISFWAIETHFGYNKGKYHLIDGLTNLSYKNRRSKFFRNELFNVLMIMDKYDLDGEKIKGSWAGAMGHFQFMPSTYNAYAIDFDGDGVADIWDSFDDAIASAANYLSKLGWKKDEPWGEEISLPWNFDYTLAGPRKFKKVSEWKKIGIRSVDGKQLKLPDDASAAITIPDGRRGRAYITLSNFRRIMIWNRSTNYALAIVKLADYIQNNKNYSSLEEKINYKLTDEDVLKVQHFANRIFKLKLKEDGKLGSKTAIAVRKLQKKWKLPQDGVPDYQLLYRIKNFKSWADFNTPPQPRKPKRKS